MACGTKDLYAVSSIGSQALMTGPEEMTGSS